MNNKIIEVQDILFKEMKRLDNMDVSLENKELQNELSKSTAIYNMSTNFIKSLNTNLTVMYTARRDEIRYEELMKKLGLEDEN